MSGASYSPEYVEGLFSEVRPRCLACTQLGRDELSGPAARTSPSWAAGFFVRPFGPARAAMARKVHGRGPEPLRQCVTEEGRRN